MRLVVDCFKLIKGAGKSIGIYNVTLSLLHNLITEKEKTTSLNILNTEIVVLGNSVNREDFDIDGVTFVEVRFYDPLKKIDCVVWELWGISRICKRLKADKVLFPRGYCALTHPVDDIVLIHDLIPFYYNQHFPGVFSKLENFYIMNRLKVSAKTSKQIITISEASKEDILKYCDVDEKKITVIYNACNAVEFNEEKVQQDLPYICAITSELPHKNAKGLLESYKEYCNITKKPLNLVIIGLRDTSISSNLPTDVKNKISCYKYIKDNNELYRLINNSSIFLFLSLVEGFGLPPIEAMMLKVPVICSNVSSLPEVVGNAAVLVDPNNYKEVAYAIIKLYNNTELQSTLVNNGLLNVQRYDWKSRAEEYWNVIRGIEL